MGKKRHRKQDHPPAASQLRMAGGSLRRRFWPILLTIVAVALVARLVAGAQLHAAYSPASHPSLSTDMATYQNLAKKVLDRTYPYEEGFYYQPFYYAVYLPLVFLIGAGTTTAVYIVQAILGAATVLLIGLTFAMILGRRAGLCGAAILALARMHIFYTPFMLIAVLQGFFMSLIMYLTVLAYRRDKLWLWAVAGLVCGMANATRGNIVLLLPLIILLLIWRRRRMLPGLVLALGLLLVTFYLPQLPFALVNYRVHGRWTGPSSAAGAVLALGNTPEAPPGGRDPDAGAGPMEYPATNNEWSRQANLKGADRVSVGTNMWRWFKREPLAYMELKFRMLLLFWHRSESPNNVAIQVGGKPVPSYVATLPLLDFTLIGALGLAGIVLALLRHRHRRAVWLLGGSVMVYCASIVLFYILARFRLPVVPLLCGFSGYAVICLVGGYKRYKATQEKRRLLVSLLVFLGTLTLVASGYDLYRYGLEKDVLRLVRPGGVRVELEHEWLVEDHGPRTYGGWLPVPIGQVVGVEKSFVLPPNLTMTEKSNGPYLRLPVNSEGAGVLQISLNGQPPISHEVSRGLQWIRVDSVEPILWNTVSIEVGFHATGGVALIFDAQRDYGRTTVTGPLQPAPGELVVELRIPKGE